MSTTFNSENVTQDDLLLSQTLSEIERCGVFNDIGLLTSSQMDTFENDVQPNYFGNFQLIDFDQDFKQEEKPFINEKRERFGESVSDSDLDALVQGQRSKNTDRNTQWAYNTFEAWRKTKPGIPVLEELDINIHLSRFVVEVRKQNGDYFPPESLYHLVCGLLRKLRDCGISGMNFLDEKNPDYARFRSVLDAQMKFLTKEGVVGKRREAQPILEDEEKVIWEKGVFGNKDALSLQHTVFFYNCKLFGLRGYDEHRNLETDQFEIGSDSNEKFIVYTGKNSKTYNGGLKHRRIEPKVIKHYNNRQNIVDYYDQYLKSVGDGSFYKRPINSQKPGDVRFSNQVVGVNKLKGFMKEICQLAGLEGVYTNHSGKKTCATSLYQKDVPEQEIMKRTGHRSVAGVRRYNKPSNEMLVDISNKLNPPEWKSTEQVKNETLNKPSTETLLHDATHASDDESKNNQSTALKPGNLFGGGQHVYNNCIFKF
ncbi:uncharacterized protein LOC132722310 [Ruditapes philippinarum]|uniref:uncharacterized protein LOC132722310 n=1 Tax=Ruditapes philippinarum TaxID=129788 RepID=UPI00295B7C10|nr:uncharacterized protein LOC132722310 [Ruditapes philippinarum]